MLGLLNMYFVCIFDLCSCFLFFKIESEQVMYEGVIKFDQLKELNKIIIYMDILFQIVWEYDKLFFF